MFNRENPNVIHIPEDKDWWVIHGAKKENTFVKEVAPRIGLKVDINPEKLTNPYAPDLILPDGTIADLKAQNTPFFMAEVKYGIPPRFAVTFNRKDYENYSENHPNIVIFFWVAWEQLSFRDISIEPLAGVWKVPFSQLKHQIESGSIQEHQYLHRVNDTRGNAKSSFIFDVRTFKELARIK